MIVSSFLFGFSNERAKQGDVGRMVHSLKLQVALADRRQYLPIPATSQDFFRKKF
jgi:hypothetical protein